MEDIFIKNIHINKVRHLENIDIPISETERKHLILTGKNGSGKTSVLLEIKNMLNMLELMEFNSFEQLKIIIDYSKNELIEIGKKIDPKTKTELNNPIEWNKVDFEQIIPLHTKSIKTATSKLSKYNVDIDFNSYKIQEPYNDGEFILSYFGAKRKLEINVPKGINQVQTKLHYQIDENIGKEFLQYIVNLKADRLFAREENDDSTANYIDAWFDNFEKSLQEIFDDNELKLEFDRKNYSFILLNKGKTPSDFTTLSDGYSAILNIISELIMRMENKASKSYDIQGIVLIDEIETHLHIDLQKKILPFLTNFFPKIQFIVTTHSPFVLNSVNNAVIFDLEKKLLVEDLSGYSVNSIIESYFDSDDYSTIVKEKVIEYERLLTKDILNEEEEEKLFDLKEYFEDLPKMFSPELALKINQIQLANLAVK